MVYVFKLKEILVEMSLANLSIVHMINQDVI